MVYTFVVLIIIKAPWITFFAIIPLIICSGVIFTCTHIIYDSLSFIIKRGDAISNSVDSALLKLTTYPPTIFNTIIKGICFSLIPAGFIAFIPSQLLRSFDIVWLLIFLAFTALIVWLAFAFFNAGLKRYNSGNLLSSRL
jgi:ABC-2 type transport system permease protein